MKNKQAYYIFKNTLCPEVTYYSYASNERLAWISLKGALTTRLSLSSTKRRRAVVKRLISLGLYKGEYKQGSKYITHYNQSRDSAWVIIQSKDLVSYNQYRELLESAYAKEIEVGDVINTR